LLFYQKSNHLGRDWAVRGDGLEGCLIENGWPGFRAWWHIGARSASQIAALAHWRIVPSVGQAGGGALTPPLPCLIQHGQQFLQHLPQGWPLLGMRNSSKGARAVRREVISSEALATSISSSTERVAVVVGRGAKAMGLGRVPQVFPGADRSPRF